MLIDCDVHVGYETVQDLVDYLDAPTRELVLHSGVNGLGLPTYPWYHPTGWIRNDTYDREAVQQGAQLPGVSREHLNEQLLDAFDVAAAVITPDEAACFSVLPNANLGARLATAYNDWLLDRWLSTDARMKGLITVAAQHPEAAAAEIRRCGQRDEFVGVFLPGGARVPYGNPMYDPLWRACEELELPVAVHTHFEGVGIAGPVTAAGYPDHYVEYHTLCGAGMYGHFVSVLCHGIFERYPHTRMIMVEGGLIPYIGLLWRLDTNWKSCRSEIPWCRRRPSEYVWEHVRFSTQPLETPDDPDLLPPTLAGLHPAETLCFASDYPHWDFDDPTQTLRLLPEEWRENVAWRNAAAFYRLRVPTGV